MTSVKRNADTCIFDVGYFQLFMHDVWFGPSVAPHFALQLASVKINAGSGNQNSPCVHALFTWETCKCTFICIKHAKSFFNSTLIQHTHTRCTPFHTPFSRNFGHLGILGSFVKLHYVDKELIETGGAFQLHQLSYPPPFLQNPDNSHSPYRFEEHLSNNRRYHTFRQIGTQA